MATKALLETLLEDDPRYAKMFAVEGDTLNNGIDLSRNYTDELDRLRDRAPVHRGSLRQLVGAPELPPGSGPVREAYSFLSFRACELAFRENVIFSSEGYNESAGIQAVGPSILSMIGRPHRRLRAAAQPLFKRPKVINWWNMRWIQETVDALLDRLLKKEFADLNADLCARLPMATVTRAFGLEGADALTFRYHLNRSTFGAREIPPDEAAESRRVVDQTLRNLIVQNTREPGDNLIAGLLVAEMEMDDGSTRKLTEEELFSYCKLTIFAGGGTTWRQLGITIVSLLEHYEYWEICRNDRSLIDRAIEESIRWRTTTAMMPRLCTQDTEVEGVLVPEGARVFLSLGSANRDPYAFDRPEQFDIFRKNKPHMGFGYGPHRCLGIDVARQELILAVNGLMDRWPNLKIDTNKSKPRFVGLDQRGMTSVNVQLR